MDKETKAAFTRRIAASNPSQMIEVLYDMLEAYLTEGEDAIARQDRAQMKDALQRASQVIEHLKQDLDFKYQIAAQLFPLYDFSQRAIAKSIYLANVTGIQEARRVMQPLQKAFAQIAKEDVSQPMMQHTQQVAAGYTYHGTQLTEATTNYDASRGFLA